MDRSEISGGLADIGTLVPLAVLLITVNQLNPTAVFGVVGLAYIVSGLYYRIPMSVQPLKSFSSLAIALGLGSQVIAAGAMSMGLMLLLLGLSGAADWIARAIPMSLVRGIQLGVGLILVRVGLGFCAGNVAQLPAWAGPALAISTGLILYLFIDSKRYPAALIAVAGGFMAGLFIFGMPSLAMGLLLPDFEFPSGRDFWKATTLLVLPQIPLTLANSVTATRQIARQYFGDAAQKVTGRSLTLGLGLANLCAGLAGGMPVCHGSGGITAHYRFGARSGASVIFVGVLLLVLALGFGPAAESLCKTIPRPVLGALMIYVGIAHGLLIKDVRGAWNWATVLATGLVGGAMNHNGYGLAAGIAVIGIQWAWTRRTVQ